MAKKSNSPTKVVVPGGVDEYILASPQEARPKLEDIRDAIQSASPGSSETVSYFQMPGYYYEGYDYNGMFAWFSYKKPFVRLHVRPPVLEDHSKEIDVYTKTRAIVSFPADEPIPKALVKKLVKASIKVMKQNAA
jgi:uncharacterized protein YdhG (YjbR/CyaY superfamily)